MGSRPNNLYLCSPAAPPAARPKGEGTPNAPGHLWREARYYERYKRNRGGGRLCSLDATLPLASRNDTSKGGAFSMSEYTQVGVRTQAQPCTHLNQPWPSVWGEIPIIEPNEGYGRIIQTPLRPIKFFVTVPHGGSVLRLYCALLAD